MGGEETYFRNSIPTPNNILLLFRTISISVDLNFPPCLFRWIIVLSVDPYGVTISVPSYVPSVNTYRDPSEQQVVDLQEERRTILEQNIGLENNTSLGDIKVNEVAQLQELYIIKLKCGMCMLETNVENFQRKNLRYT